MTAGEDLAKRLGIPEELRDNPADLGLTGEYVPALSCLSRRKQLDVTKAVAPLHIPHWGAVIDGAVMFVDISAFTAQSNKLKPEQVAYWVNRFFKELWPTCERFHATFDKTIGDCLMLVLSPKLGCHSPFKNAVELALSVLRWDVYGYEPHVGIADGWFWLGFTGPLHAMSVSAFGSVVNKASRLANAAKGSCVAVESASWRTISDSWESMKTRLKLENFSVEQRSEELKGFGASDVTVLKNRAIWIADFTLPPVRFFEADDAEAHDVDGDPPAERPSAQPDR